MHPKPLECVESRHGGTPAGSVVWLHGLGADGHDFAPVVPELGLPLDYIFPHAPVRPVTVNGGMPMRAWYDILSLDRDARVDERGLAESARQVETLITREVERGAERVVLAGFSQGGSLALTVGMRVQATALIGLSCWLPPGTDPDRADWRVPVLMAHGTEDPLVEFGYGVATRDALRAAGWDVEWHEYPMAHGVCPDEIAAIRAFLMRVLQL